jgi:predicted DNA binding CopG/RHH family protein
MQKRKSDKLYVPDAAPTEGRDADWSKAERAVLPNLRPTTTSISVRLPVSMLDELKALAHSRDVPYRSLLKIFLAERLSAERKAG